MENTEQTLVSFTGGALSEIKQILSSKEDVAPATDLESPIGLRLGVEGGGCAGLSYTLAFDHKKQNDLEYFVDGIVVYMNKAQSMYLSGMEVDYQDGLNARGFTFNNPNAQSTCGCGSSFGI